MYEKQEFINNFLTENNVDSLLVWRASELVKLSAYHPHWGLTLGLYEKDKNPTLLVPELEPDFLLPQEADIIKFPWGRLMPHDPWSICFEKINNFIYDNKITKLGIFKHTGSTTLFGNHGEMPPLPTDFLARIDKLDCEIVNLDDENQKFYHIKSQQDIAHLERTHKVAKVAIKAFYESLKVGETEASISSKVETAVQEENGKYGQLSYYCWAYVQGGRHTTKSGQYNKTGGKILKKYDPVLLEMAVCVGGFWADLTRCGFIESPTSRDKELSDLIATAQQKAISALRPGVPVKDIDAIARNFLTENGVGEYFNHALGHHVGYKYHEPTAISPYSDSVLEEGMVITIEPGIYIPQENIGIRKEDNILITKNGHRILSDYYR